MRSRLDKLHGLPVPYDTSVEELRALLKPAGPRAWVAFEALSFKLCRESLEVLENSARSQDSQIRLSAIRAIGRHVRGNEAVATVLLGFDDAVPAVVRTACVAAAELHAKEAHDRIVALLKDEDRHTRNEALRSIEAVWRQSDVDDVWVVHISDSSIHNQSTAAFVLRNQATDKTWRSLFDRWIDGPLARYRTWACQLAQRFGVDPVADRVRPLLNDKDGHVRKAAARCLSKGQDSV